MRGSFGNEIRLPESFKDHLPEPTPLRLPPPGPHEGVEHAGQPPEGQTHICRNGDQQPPLGVVGAVVELGLADATEQVKPHLNKGSWSPGFLVPTLQGEHVGVLVAGEIWEYFPGLHIDLSSTKPD